VYAKVRQDQIVMDFGRRHSLPFVIVRPGVVYGSGNEGISGRIGVGTFGLFLHLGGSNRIPLTHVRNCADAIVLAGLVGGIDHQVFNIVDDDLPTSRQFLREYKRRVRSFHSVYMPKLLSYGLCALIEKYSEWSRGQVPPFMNRHMWHAYWKSTHYSNERAKRLLGWAPSISMSEGLHSYFESCRRAIENPPAVRSQTPPV
jgi:nucleoside-diphosphate-sugar epimerase